LRSDSKPAGETGNIHDTKIFIDIPSAGFNEMPP